MKVVTREMGRHRRLTPISLTTLAITTETQKLIKELKRRRETQDSFINRVLLEWQSSKEVIKDLELAEKYKDRRIEQYSAEIERLKTQIIENNPAIQELR
jgi:predicted NACHT family NTPase